MACPVKWQILNKSLQRQTVKTFKNYRTIKKYIFNNIRLSLVDVNFIFKKTINEFNDIINQELPNA